MVLDVVVVFWVFFGGDKIDLNFIGYFYFFVFFGILERLKEEDKV